MSINTLISQLKKSFTEELSHAKSTRQLEELKVSFLGKKGKIASLMSELRNASPEEKPLLGKLINDLKEEIEALLESAFAAAQGEELEKALEGEKIDISLPGRRRYLGRKHPLSQVMDQVLSILSEMGFSVQTGPDIELDYYNFEGLNYPPDHPARDMQDTFYLSEKYLLRSHTSNVQLRAMESHTPPIRIVAPGNVYRNETVSARSHVFFHQVEGLYVDQNVSLADLLATLKEFWSKLFSKEVEMRFRPSFFPFVEPGIEVDLACISCAKKGCRLCKQSGYLEVAGAGMVHPQVLKNGGIDPEVYTGYAWGMGIERIAMLLFGIDDIRLFFENDLRFLEQF